MGKNISVRLTLSGQENEKNASLESGRLLYFKSPYIYIYKKRLEYCTCFISIRQGSRQWQKNKGSESSRQYQANKYQHCSQQISKPHCFSLVPPAAVPMPLHILSMRVLFIPEARQQHVCPYISTGLISKQSSFSLPLVSLLG